MLVWIIAILFFYTVNSKCILQLNGYRILYKRYFVFLLRTNILFFFFFHPLLSKCLFCCKNRCVLKLRDDLFKANWIMLGFSSFSCPLNHLKDCRGRESEALTPPPQIREGTAAGCIRMYQDVLKEKLCCSNSFFCCSLDGQDVLHISVLWAWCFNKKDTYLCNCCVFDVFLSRVLRNWALENVG